MADLISDIIPQGEVSILAGASGAGKTTLIQQILARMQLNKDVFGSPVSPNLRLGYIAADRSWESYKRTAALTKVNLSRLGVRTLVDDDSIDLRVFKKNPIQVLEELIQSLLPLDLVVVDPLVVFLGVDTNKYHLNAAALIRLNRFCRKHNITILGTHHATKARSDYTFKRAQDRISGTSALLGFTSTQLFLATPEELGREDGVYEWHIISHHAPAKVIELSRENGAFTLVGERLTVNTPLEDRVVSFLASSEAPVSRRELIERFATEVSVPTVDRLLSRLVKDGSVNRVSGEYTVHLHG